jgi:cytochrome c556
MRKPVLTTLAIAAVLAASAAALLSQPDSTKRTLMKAKAGYAHRLFDAVVQEEFEVIQDQAFRLKAVTETADWNATKTPWFVRESDAFIRATDQLYAAAKAKDGDAAALAFVDLTLRCVHCHQGLRSEP